MTKKRPPIVVIMGHVDHGKTTLLDYIRKTNIAAKEAGGITQSVGAYEIAHNDKKITFIDTPGHEAFAKMRAYGARVADLAILVVAADDGVKPQTKEAFKYIAQQKLPFVVAINKIDKSNADIQKAKQDLSQNEIFLEGFGGNVSWHAISAKTGEGVNELLDLIILAAELENLTYDPQAPATGLIMGSRPDPRRGILVSVILKDGRLEIGQNIATRMTKGKIRNLENFLGQPVQFLEPSAPGLISGFETLPEIGEEFLTFDGTPPVFKAAEFEIKAVTEQRDETQKINIIIKSGESGSLEALEDILKKLCKTLPLNIVFKKAGNIHESDVKLAGSTNALIAGFKVKIDKAAQNIAKAQKVTILTSEIIYELEKKLTEYAKKVSSVEMRALEVLAIFGESKGKERVVGGRVVLGPIKNQEKFEIWRDKKLIGSGKILNLQSQKKDIAQVEAGGEVGLLIESDEPVKVKDKLAFID